ncbi:hypothetical protein M8J75_007816 [Diaphorina citri]|nr:hypothetical protein M8J75_007816 [Diaphorina citri]
MEYSENQEDDIIDYIPNMGEGVTLKSEDYQEENGEAVDDEYRILEIGATNEVNIDYVPDSSEDVTLKTEVCEEQNGELVDENHEYIILDIGGRDETKICSFSEFQDNPEEVENYSDDDNDEDRGVLKHAWQDEDPNQSEDETEPDPKLKSAFSNIAKFINFLNKLQEDHHQFINSDIKDDKVIEEQKRGVVINAHMISDLVKINFDSNNMRVNEIVHELKKILAVKVDLFDKLYDKQVNGVVSTDVVKRLFSGNNLLIKTQIEELRRILFTKLDSVNRQHTINVQKLKTLKQAKRKTSNQKVQVFRRDPVEPSKIDRDPLVASKIDKDPFVPSKIDKDPFVPSKIETKTLKNQRRSTTSNMEQKLSFTLQDIHNQKCLIEKQMEKLVKSELLERENAAVEDNVIVKSEPLEDSDFHSFTQIVSEKLKLKPEESSPSSILNKFRNNLNKKLQDQRAKCQDETQVSIIELGLDDFKDEEDLVEEVFYEDIIPEDVQLPNRWNEDSHVTSQNEPTVDECNDSSYVIENISNYRPDYMSDGISSYNINHVTLTKLPTASKQTSKLEHSRDKTESTKLYNLDIEKALLEDRPKALRQLDSMVELPKDKSIQNKFLNNPKKFSNKILGANERRVIKTYLQNRLSELEHEAELARKHMAILDQRKTKAKKEINLQRPIKEITDGSEEEHIIPDVDLSQATNLDKKIKALFQHNNLKGNLKKRKLPAMDPELNHNNVKNVLDNRKGNSKGNVENRFITLSNVKTNSKIVIDKEKICYSDSTENNDSITYEYDDQNEVQVSKDRLGRKLELPYVYSGRGRPPNCLLTPAKKCFNNSGKKTTDIALSLPGKSTKLKKKRSHRPHWLESGDAQRLCHKSKRKPTSSHVPESKEQSNSKKLLENLKKQIFDKLHKQDNTKRAAEVRKEIERRLRRKEKSR